MKIGQIQATNKKDNTVTLTGHMVSETDVHLENVDGLCEYEGDISEALDIYRIYQWQQFMGGGAGWFTVRTESDVEFEELDEANDIINPTNEGHMTPEYGDITATIKAADYVQDRTELTAVVTPNGTVRVANKAHGTFLWNGPLKDALEKYNLWTWDGAGWMAIHDIDDVLPELDEKPATDKLLGVWEDKPVGEIDKLLAEHETAAVEPKVHHLRFPRREMFHAALREYLGSYDVRTAAPLVTFTLDTDPLSIVEMVLRDVTEVDDDVSVFVGRPKEDSSYGPKMYVLSKAVIDAEVAE